MLSLDEAVLKLQELRTQISGGTILFGAASNGSLFPIMSITQLSMDDEPDCILILTTE